MTQGILINAPKITSSSDLSPMAASNKNGGKPGFSFDPDQVMKKAPRMQ